MHSPLCLVSFHFFTISLNHIPINIAAAYFAPRQTITTQQLKQFFTSLGYKFIAGEDFNAKNPYWGCLTSKPRENNLPQLISPQQYQVHSPPYLQTGPRSQRNVQIYLIFFISKALNHLFHHIENFNDLYSDHSAVLLTLNSSPPNRFNNNSYLVNKTTDCIKFIELLLNMSELNIKLKYSDNIDDAINNLSTTIQSAAWNSTFPIKTPYI